MSVLLRDKVLEVAVAEVGVRESGTNRGARVEEYLAAVGLEGGFPWCAAFVVWAYRQAAKALGMKQPLPATGGVHRLWERAPSLRSTAWPPVPGAVYLHDSGEGKGHCGLVVSVCGDHIVGCEGNTDAEGSREGDGVRLKIRRRGYVNLGYLAAP